MVITSYTTFCKPSLYLIIILADTRLCKNGEVMQKNEILQLCVDGKWRTMCPRLWGPAQAMVACRQLNPGKVVIGKTCTILQLYKLKNN